MAKAFTKREVQASLKAAAKILNNAKHRPDRKRRGTANLREEMAVSLNEIIFYQVWCYDEKKVVSDVMYNEIQAEKFKDRHNKSTGHSSEVLTSSKKGRS